MKGLNRFTVLSGAAAVAFLVLFITTMLSPPQQTVFGAPAAAPTPVLNAFSSSASKYLPFLPARRLTGDFCSAYQTISENEVTDLQWIIDNNGALSVTLLLKFSNDGVNAVDGPTFQTATRADVDQMQQYAIFGRQAQVCADLLDSGPITVTVLGLGK